MLTIVDRPLIQYAVDEAREAGIEQMIFVTGRGKSRSSRLFRHRVRARSDDARARQEPRRARAARANFGEIVSVRQQQPLGLGHAVWCARDIVGDEPFAVLLPDDLMVGKPGCLKQMVDAYEKVGGNIVCARKCRRDDRELRHHHARARTTAALTEVKGLVEKPQPGRRAVAARRGRPLHPPARGDGALEGAETRAPAARSS
jgi:UTP--glucose-1-phosphate uridylyltransferase